MRRRGTASLAASPVLVGAVTVLVTVIAVFIAYQANQGLPFVPTYDVKAEVPNAQKLVRGNEVRAGGFGSGSWRAPAAPAEWSTARSARWPCSR